MPWQAGILISGRLQPPWVSWLCFPEYCELYRKLYHFCRGYISLLGFWKAIRKADLFNHSRSRMFSWDFLIWFLLHFAMWWIFKFNNYLSHFTVIFILCYTEQLPLDPFVNSLSTLYVNMILEPIFSLSLSWKGVLLIVPDLLVGGLKFITVMWNFQLE